MENNKMKIESHVTNLEISKRLKEIGIKQESLFYWVRVPTNDENIDGYGLKYLIDMFFENNKFKEIYSSYLASELLEILPDEIICQKIIINMECNWLCSFYMDGDKTMQSISTNLQDSCAEMLITLIENDYIKC